MYSNIMMCPACQWLIHPASLHTFNGPLPAASAEIDAYFIPDARALGRHTEREI